MTQRSCPAKTRASSTPTTACLSPLWAATRTGTPVSPVKTIGRALNLGQGKRVYACATAGDYAEQVNITAATALFGGFDCSGPNWSYATTRAARVKSPVGTALAISGTPAGAVRLEDIEFDAPPTAMKGESSVAGLVSEATNVRLTRVKLVATDAQPGADATPPLPNYSSALTPDDSKLAGNNALDLKGGLAQACAMLCANSVHSTGGSGGDGVCPGATLW